MSPRRLPMALTPGRGLLTLRLYLIHYSIFSPSDSAKALRNLVRGLVGVATCSSPCNDPPVVALKRVHVKQRVRRPCAQAADRRLGDAVRLLEREGRQKRMRAVHRALVARRCRLVAAAGSIYGLGPRTGTPPHWPSALFPAPTPVCPLSIIEACLSGPPVSRQARALASQSCWASQLLQRWQAAFSKLLLTSRDERSELGGR